jgi:glycine cleavage system H protein
VSVWRGCDIPTDRTYDVEGDLWVQYEEDLVRLGLTDVGQTRMGRMVTIRFKQPGRRVRAGGSVATVESAKWVGPVHTPFAAEVVEANEAAFARDILLANRDPYEEGWISLIRPDPPGEPNRPLLRGKEAVATYKARIESLEVSCFRCED